LMNERGSSKAFSHEGDIRLLPDVGRTVGLFYVASDENGIVDSALFDRDSKWLDRTDWDNRSFEFQERPELVWGSENGIPVFAGRVAASQFMLPDIRMADRFVGLRRMAFIGSSRSPVHPARSIRSICRSKRLRADRRFPAASGVGDGANRNIISRPSRREFPRCLPSTVRDRSPLVVSIARRSERTGGANFGYTVFINIC